ncbi:MAG: mechanosensitive ion channel domain-containing protein [bacterium]
MGDILGNVVKISARSTTVRTLDNIAIIVPNPNFIS